MPHRFLGLILSLLAALALGIALASEHWGGLVPCALCLWERWPYRTVMILGALAVILPRPWARLALWIACATLLTGVLLGAIHVGVEWKFWPSPLPECAAPDLSGLSIAERLARMPATPAKPCDEPTYLLPVLPLSMAMMNFLLALAMAGGLAIALRRRQARTP